MGIKKPVALKYVIALKKNGMSTRRCNKNTIIMYRMYNLTFPPDLLQRKEGIQWSRKDKNSKLGNKILFLQLVFAYKWNNICKKRFLFSYLVKSAKINTSLCQSLWLPNCHWYQEFSHSQVRLRHSYKKQKYPLL